MFGVQHLANSAVVVVAVPHNAKRNQPRMRQWDKIVRKVPRGRVLRRPKGKLEQSKTVHCESTLTFTCPKLNFLQCQRCQSVTFCITPLIIILLYYLFQHLSKNGYVFVDAAAARWVRPCLASVLAACGRVIAWKTLNFSHETLLVLKTGDRSHTLAFSYLHL